MVYEGFPLVVGWELTLACNLRCAHCGSSAGLPRANELTAEESIAICDQFPELFVQEVNFTGGEPLLNPAWPVIAARLGELGIRVQVISNGLVLSRDMARRLKEAGIGGVGVSIDGLEKTHDAIRGKPGVFRAAMEGIGNLLEAGIPVTAITSVNAANVGELGRVMDALVARGVRQWQLQPVFPLGRLRESGGLQLTTAAYGQIGDFIRDNIGGAERRGLKVLPADSFGYFMPWDEKLPPWGGCNAGMVTCGIMSDGRIKGCLSMPDEMVEGDLRRSDLWDIWFGPNSFSYNRKFTVGDLGPNCASCGHGEECRGGCTSMSYGSTGRLHNDPYCIYGYAQRARPPDGREA